MIKLFPTILIVLDLCSSFIYLINGDVRMFFYWLAAATLTFTITY